MKAVFVELPAFQRYRERYLDDVAYANFLRLFDKNEVKDLLISERMALARFLRHEIEART